MRFKQTITRSLINIPGWHTNRKIVVIESDDWGSIRMPSRKIYDSLVKNGIRVDNLPYTRFDSLANNEDLTALLETLSSVKDKNGKPAVLTANTIIANPDFNKIRASNFLEYHYELFTETLKRYPEHDKSFELWKEGMQAGVFRPQFHGREHLNVKRWMRALQQNTGNARLAFDYYMFDLSTSQSISEDSFMEALNFEDADEFEFQKQSIIEGLHLFEQLFGYKSETFIAPCYIWSDELNETLKNCGVNAFQGAWYQFNPIAGKENNFKKRFHYTGQKNKLKQIYMVRNAAFEPSGIPTFDWVNDILGRMEIIFRMHKPAIICTHRLNFIGFIDSKNRDCNLSLFHELLKKMLLKWPDIEFMSSDQLSEIMKKNHT